MNYLVTETRDWTDAEGKAPHRESEETLYLTTEECLKWIGKAPRGARFYLHVRLDAAVAGTEDQVFPDACAGGVRVTPRELMDFVRQGLTARMEERGARWRAQVTKYKPGERLYVSYWVG
jgi:hypothetical protein